MSLRAPTLSLSSLALAALAGCAVVQVMPALPSFIATLAVMAVAAGLCMQHQWPWPRLAGVALLFACWCCLHAAWRMQARLPVALQGRQVTLTGRIADLPRRQGADVSFLFMPDAGAEVSGAVRVTWYRASETPAPCSRWQLALRLRRPRGLVNPGGNDGERAALMRGLVATGYVRRSPDNRQTGAGPCVDGWRNAIGQGIDHAVGERRARLLKAMAVGDTRGLDAADWDIARTTGTSHLIAISGFHVGVAAGGGTLVARGIYLLLPWLATRVPRGFVQGALGLITAAVYSLLAGMGLPTVRALLMVTVVVLAALSRRRTHGLSLLALALLAVLVVDPLAVLSAGFWLSFAGVAFLMACVSPTVNGWRGRVLLMVRTQALMSLALLPLCTWLFGTASLVGFVANLVAAPVVSFIAVPMALVGCVLLPMGSWASLPLNIGGMALDALWSALAPMSAWPGARLSPASSGVVAVVLATGGMLWLFAPRGMPLRGLAAFMALPWLFPLRHDPTPGGFSAWVLDVGQGLAVLIRTQSHTLLYDTGPGYAAGYDAASSAVLPSITALGIAPLNTLVISHGDNDHAGGAASVARRYPSASRISGEPPRAGVPSGDCKDSSPWSWDGVRFRFIASSVPAAGRKTPSNDRSCVLLVEGEGGRLLLPGDISAQQESRLDHADLTSPLPTVTVVAHHGSRHSSGATWLARVRPRIAVASAGWRNRFGHPHPLVVDRHAGAGASFFDTPRSGAIELAFPANAPPFVRREWRRPSDHYWRE